MTLFENPIRLAQQVCDLRRSVGRWQQRLRQGDVDPSGPFIGRPELTTRAAFAAIAELNVPPSVKLAWTRWALYLSDARVNAPLLAGIAQAYRVEGHKLERPQPVELTLRELLRRTLSRPSERELWAGFLAAHAWTLQSLTIELVARRDEIARRAGYSSYAALTCPVEDPRSLANRMLAATDDIHRSLVPPDLGGWLDAALAVRAVEGWPAHLRPRTVEQLLGNSNDWLSGLDLAARHLPEPIAASSFARSLWALGESVAEAAAPKSEPFFIAHDPYGLIRHTVGALFAQLTTSERWHKDVLGLSPSKAREQSRQLMLSQLILARTTVLSLLVRDAVRATPATLTRDFEEAGHRVLGFVPPEGFAAVVPKLRRDAEQRLIGQWLAAEWTRELVAKFDEDWFRNPRGIEAVRDRLSGISPISVSMDEANRALDAFVSGVTSGL